MKESNNTIVNQEYTYKGKIFNGFLILGAWFVILALLVWFIIDGIDTPEVTAPVSIFVFLLLSIGLGGFFIQEPNQARVLIFFGKYCGTCRNIGYSWINPFYSRKKISLRISNMDVEPIKVNDKVGNPVLIGMVLVWRVKDTYKVIFDLNSMNTAAGNVDMSSLQHFVRIQSDAALREVTSCFPYDPENHDSNELTLRNGGDRINEILEAKINERLAIAGLEAVEARINYLAYAPEIAAVMLRRQQASAIISAREKIVEGAVSMVELALRQLEEHKMVEFDNATKASLISNLMVVLCADEPASPVLNTGL